MEIEPTYQELLERIAAYIKNRKNVAIAGIHDAGKTYLFNQLKQENKNKSVAFFDLSTTKSPTKRDLQVNPKYQEIREKGGVLVINFGYKVTPSESFLKYLETSRQEVSKKFSWVLFTNYSSYKKEGDIIYHKMFKVNFIPIPALKRKDMQLMAKDYEREMGKIDPKLVEQVVGLSGGNPGLFKSLWSVARRDSGLTKVMGEPSLLARLEKITEELDDKEVLVLLKKSDNRKILSRLKLIGFMKPSGEIFSPLLREYLVSLLEEEGLDLKLSLSEKRLLKLFAENEGSIVSRDDIAKALWKNKWNEKYSDWAIDTAIKSLRAKIKGTKYGGKVLTKRGEGYYLKKN